MRLTRILYACLLAAVMTGCGRCNEQKTDGTYQVHSGGPSHRAQPSGPGSGGGKCC